LAGKVQLISEVAKKVITLTQRYVPIQVQKKNQKLKKTFIFAMISNYTIIIVKAKKNKTPEGTIFS
jgi:hypothetical protein